MRKVLLAAASALALVGAYACGNDCQDGCDKLAECFSDTPELVSDTCVEDCEADLEGENAEDTQKCLDCIVDTDCAEAFPTDGSAGACAEDCGG